MKTIALRVSVILAIFCSVLAPARAGTPGPTLVVEVFARGEGVNARISVPNRDDQHAFVPLGERREFEFPLATTKYTFAISGCGRVQTKTLTIPVGRGGALITVYKDCALVISGR